MSSKLDNIILGGGQLSGEAGGYSFGAISEKESTTLIQDAFHLGIRSIDTAPIYGFGESEKRIAKGISCFAREDIILHNKGGIFFDSNKRIDISNERKIIEKMFYQSLKDLKTDYIDYYYIHHSDPRCDIRYALEFLNELKEKKLIHSIGLSNSNMNDYQKGLEVAKIDAFQEESNLLTNHFSFLANIDLKTRNDLSFIGVSLFDKGILSGSVKDEKRVFHEKDVRRWAPWWKKEKEKREKKIMKVSLIEKELKDIYPSFNIYHLSLSYLQYSLKNKTNNQQVVGLKNMRQLEYFTSCFKEIDESVFLNWKKHYPHHFLPDEK